METIALILNLFFWAVLIAVILMLLYLGWCRIKEKRADDLQTYNIMYLNIKTIIDKRQVNETSCNKLIGYFGQLRKCRYRNVEKTRVLWQNFCEKYKDVSKKVLSEADEK